MAWESAHNSPTILLSLFGSYFYILFYIHLHYKTKQKKVFDLSVILDNNNNIDWSIDRSVGRWNSFQQKKLFSFLFSFYHFCYITYFYLFAQMLLPIYFKLVIWFAVCFGHAADETGNQEEKKTVKVKYLPLLLSQLSLSFKKVSKASLGDTD